MTLRGAPEEDLEDEEVAEGLLGRLDFDLPLSLEYLSSTSESVS